jgi:hypothetical protein
VFLEELVVIIKRKLEKLRFAELNFAYRVWPISEGLAYVISFLHGVYL